MDYIDILTMYLSVSSVSAAFNLYHNFFYHKRNVKEVKRKLEFRELSTISKENLEEIDIHNSYDNKLTLFYSFIPIYNVFYSSVYMLTDPDELDEMYKQTYSKIIDTTNSLEREVRTKYINHLKMIREQLVISKEYAESIDKENLNISEKDYKKILKLNNIKYDEDILLSINDKKLQ